MDLLNNFWNLLTTENEVVTKIIYSFTVFIESWLVFQIFVLIFKIKYTKRQKYLYITSFSLISLIIEFVVPSPFNTFINYITMFIILKFLFKLDNIKTILCTILPTIIFALVSSLLLKPFLLIFDISYSDVETIPLYRLTYLTLLYLIIFLIILKINTKKFKFYYSESFNKKNRIIIFTNMLLGFFTLGVQLTITVFYTDVLPTFIGILSFLSLLTYFFISFYSLLKTNKLQVATKNLENAEIYNKTLSILYDNVKAFKHDFDNMIFTIGGFVNTNDIDGLKQYYASLEKECQKVNNLALLNPTLINNPGIYNLLTAKYQKAHNNKVDIDLEFFFDLNKLHMPIYDFSRMLGILLDNAIEAASVSKEKVIKIMFRDSINSKVQIVEIKNSYINKNIDTKNIFNKGITEKKNHLGMGLWEVNKIISRNNNINLFTENDNLYFTQRLEIYY